MANYVREIMNHDYYEVTDYQSNGQIISYLSEKLSKNEAKTPFLFTCLRTMPGYFLLFYKAGKNYEINFEYIKITPKGFQVKKRLFKSLIKVLKYFI